MLGLNWPPFLAAIFLLFWSPVFSGALTYQVQYLNFWGKRNDVIGWCARGCVPGTRAKPRHVNECPRVACRVLGMKIFFRWKVLKVGEQDLYRGKCVYLVSPLRAAPACCRSQLSARAEVPRLHPAATPALQCNHRSWADFMVDQYATEGRSAFMSRCVDLFVLKGGGGQRVRLTRCAPLHLQVGCVLRVPHLCKCTPCHALRHPLQARPHQRH